MSVVDGVLWLSGDQGMSCADPRTGGVLLRAKGQVVYDYPPPVPLDSGRFLVAVPSAGRTRTIVVAHAKQQCLSRARASAPRL